MPFSRSAPRRWPLTLVGLFLAALPPTLVAMAAFLLV